MMDERAYVLTNDADGNSVLVFTRSADGTLLPLGTLVVLGGNPIYQLVDPFPTGGLGNEVLFASQGSVILSRDGRYLFAVNAGSNEVSSFIVTPGGLQLVSTVSSGGIEPRSLTVFNDLLYVLNGVGTGSVSGFRIGLNGALTPLDESQGVLSSAGSEPVQVSFNPDGTLLVVSELFANRISVFQIGEDGRPTDLEINPSAGPGPFGFAFNRNGHLIVSESGEPGAAEGAGAVSSYDVDTTGKLSVISASVRNGQTASCWIANTPDGRYSYTSNTNSGTISGYRVDSSGMLSLLDADGRTGVTGDFSFPIDMAINRDGQYLYVLNRVKQTIAAFLIESDGRLTLLPSVGNLPPLSVGLALE